MLDIQNDIRIAPYTTFNIGGGAKYFIEVSNEEGLRESFAFANEKKIKFVILAGGSNMLFPDEGFDGLVIRIVPGDNENVVIYYNKIIVSAGMSLTKAIRDSAVAGLGGWENMCGIPGSVGGAVRGNAGAFGTEVKDVLSKVRAMNLQTGEVRDFNNKDCEFDYRTSYFKTHPEWVVLTAVFKLAPVVTINTEDCSTPPKLNPLQKCDEIVGEREKRHLQNVQAAGSFFKNPVCVECPDVIKQFEVDKGVVSKGGKVPAGWLIDKCGLNGTKVGGAICSEQHPNYIVNIRNATAKDVLKLRDIIKEKVKKEFGIELEEEVAIIK